MNPPSSTGLPISSGLLLYRPKKSNLPSGDVIDAVVRPSKTPTSDLISSAACLNDVEVAAVDQHLMNIVPADAVMLVECHDCAAEVVVRDVQGNLSVYR